MKVTSKRSKYADMIREWLSKYVVSRAHFDREMAVQQQALEEARRCHNKNLIELRNKHDVQLEEHSKRVDETIRRCASVHFNRDDRQHYAVTVTFDTRLLDRADYREDRRLVADRIGHMVADEIFSLRFVQPARKTEYAPMYHWAKE